MTPPPATLTFSLTWTDCDCNAVRPGPRTIACPYTVYEHGEVPVPAGSVAGQEFDIPSGGLVQGATLVLIENLTRQELNTAWGGNWAPHLPAAGVFLFALPTEPSSGGIVGWRFMLTADQVAAGCVSYLLLGK